MNIVKYKILKFNFDNFYNKAILFCRCFESSKSVYSHVYSAHVVTESDGVCKWEGCEKLERKKWSLVTHIQVGIYSPLLQLTIFDLLFLFLLSPLYQIFAYYAPINIVLLIFFLS